jgi:hypothetical protein
MCYHGMVLIEAQDVTFTRSLNSVAQLTVLVIPFHKVPDSNLIWDSVLDSVLIYKVPQFNSENGPMKAKCAA